MTGGEIIEVRQAVKRFGELCAVDGIDLAVNRGEIFGLIGHNGAGKSTLFKMMLGLLPLTSGDIHIDGHPPAGEAFRRVRRSVGYLPENVVFYDNLTGLETLWLFADLKRVRKDECMPMLEKVGLGDAARRRVRGYSKGMRQRLGFAQAMLGTPKIMFLDEPTTGLDPEGIREFYRILGDMGREGMTVILSSHILAEVQERVDRLAIIKAGRVRALGTMEALRMQANLPLRFRIAVTAGGTGAVWQILRREGVTDVGVAGDGVISAPCSRWQKMDVLRALASLGGRVADIQIMEPTLEEIFLGYENESGEGPGRRLPV